MIWLWILLFLLYRAAASAAVGKTPGVAIGIQIAPDGSFQLFDASGAPVTITQELLDAISVGVAGSPGVQGASSRSVAQPPFNTDYISTGAPGVSEPPGFGTAPVLPASTGLGGEPLRTIYVAPGTPLGGNP
jgi:hypothetical protein